MSRRSRSSRILRIAPAVAAALALAPAATASAAVELKPNLGVLPPSDIRVEKKTDGRKLLRYSSIIVNKARYQPSSGQYGGQFEVLGKRTSTSQTTMAVSQRIRRSDGTSVTYSIPNAYMYYATEDGHHHWHVRNMETGELWRTDGNWTKAGTVVKRGYCFYDNYKWNLSLPGAPQSSRFTWCGDTSSMSVDTGLSIGWGDRYAYYLGLQYIPVTNLPTGNYRLRISANTAIGFHESNTGDNAACAWLYISGGGSNLTVKSTGYCS